MTSRPLRIALFAFAAAAGSSWSGCSSSTAVVATGELASEPAPPPPVETSPAATYAEDPAAVDFGRRYFRAVCTGYCHSTQPGVKRDAPDLFDCDWRHGDRDEDLFEVISQGVPDTEMLPFGEKLDDEVLWKIIAFLRSSSRCVPG